MYKCGGHFFIAPELKQLVHDRLGLADEKQPMSTTGWKCHCKDEETGNE